MKKVLSLVLVIAMVLSSMSFAFAGTFEDVTGDYEKAVDTLSALGVIDGYDDGTFKPEKTITRAEMAKLMVITLGYGDLVAGSKSNFTDTQGHWADAYIALAAGKGIVLGDGNGTFRPDAQVTYNEVFTMLVRGLGYTDNCNELAGMSWPTNFKVKAAELGITDDVVMNTTGADRGGVAQSIFNALNATLVTVDSDGDVTLVVDREDEQVELFTRLAELDSDYVVSEEVLDSDNKNYGGNLVDLEPYMFQSLKVYLNDDDEVVYIKSSNSLVVEGEYDDDNAKVLTIEQSNGKTKDVDFAGSDLLDGATTDVKAAYIFRNGSINESKVALADFADFETVKVVVADDKALGGDDDGKIDADEIVGVVATERTELIRLEKEYVDGKDSIDGIELPVDSKDKVDLEGIKVTGDAESLEDIKVDDIVVAYASEDETAITLVVTRNAVEGKVTKVTDKNTVAIDGTTYDLASLSLVGDWDLELGDEGIFFLDQEGDIADYDGESVGPTDYAVVFGSDNGDVAEKFGGISVDHYAELKLATQEGEEVVYEVAVEVNEDGTIDESAEITDSEVGAIAEGAIFTATVANDGDILDIESIFLPTHAYLVQYSLDSDGRIDEIEVIADVTAYETAGNNLADIDLDDDTLVDGVIIFDAGDDYAVVDVDALDTEFEAYAIEDKNGDLEVLVVKAGEVDAAADTIFAYLNKVELTYNEAGDKVHAYTVYVDGVKKTILADDDMSSVDVKNFNRAISFDYNNGAIDESDVNFAPTGWVATATSISASKGRIQLDLVNNGTYADGFFKLSEHATIVEIDPTVDSTPNSVNDIKDLYDIDEDDVVTVYINSDGDIDLIVIEE